MTRVTAQETRRLFGAFQPNWKTNVRHRAILRKALELFTMEQLVTIFGPRPSRLQVAMGRAGTFSQLGKIRCNYVHTLSQNNSCHQAWTDCQCYQVHNNHLVSLETDTLPFEAPQRLQDYATVYDTGFMSQGNDYVARHPHARADLQVAEQAWHNWVVGYQPRPRPDWALQPIPGLHMVRIAGPAARTPILAPPRIAVAVPIATPRVTLPALITMPHIAVQTPTRPRRSRIPLPTPPPSSPISEAGSSFLNPIDVSDSDDSDEDSADEYFDEDMCLPIKRNFLGTIEISDKGEPDEEERPSKRIRVLGVLDSMA
ncbi:hypothetical protein K438DRAFT_1765559 [Mycena galopus ATCC 62051]|nr:hypothetical protein K438DRAFT_1765559 [Mycena galopus ATCC 62051]